MNTLRLISMLVGLCFMGVSTLVIAASTKGANPNGKPFIELQGQIIEVEGEVSTLQDQIDAMVGQVDTIEARLAADLAAINSLETLTADLEAQIGSNAADIASLQLQVDDLEAENVDLQNQIDAYGDYVYGTLQDQIDANLALITILNQTISDLSLSLQDQITNNTDLITLLQAEINDIDAFLLLKQNLVVGTCPDGSAVKEVLTTGEVVCESVAASGGSGTLETVQSIGVSLTPNIIGLIFGAAIANCPPGYLATGAGWIGAPGSGSFNIGQVLITGDQVSVNVSLAHDSFSAIATCARIAP